MKPDFTKHASRFIEHPKLLTELVDLAVSDLNHPYPEYASWLLVHVAHKQPRLLIQFQPIILDKILVSKNQSVLRNLVNVCHLLPLIEYKEAEMLDRFICFIKDDSNKAALFVYSIYKLIQFSQKYPEIHNEIEETIGLKQESLKPSVKIAIRNYRLAVKNGDSNPH